MDFTIKRSEFNILYVADELVVHGEERTYEYFVVAEKLDGTRYAHFQRFTGQPSKAEVFRQIVDKAPSIDLQFWEEIDPAYNYTVEYKGQTF